MSKAMQATALMIAGMVGGMGQNAELVDAPRQAPAPKPVGLARPTRTRVRRESHVLRRSHPRRRKPNRWALPHPAARGQDESLVDYRMRQNILKRLRKLQSAVVWQSNVERAKADTRRSRTRSRAETRRQKVVSGRIASEANRRRVAEERAARAAE